MPDTEAGRVARLWTPREAAAALAPCAAQYRLVLALTADLAPADAAGARRAWRAHLHRTLANTLRTAAWLAGEAAP